MRFAMNNRRLIKDQPGLDRYQEALLLREHFTELLCTKESSEIHRRFQEWTNEGEAARHSDSFVSGMNRVTKNCAACH
ncbi:MAG: hypothetical protein ACKVP0_15765 [Pirellulaceae bacterium]